MKAFLPVVLVALTAGPVLAADRIYECDFPDHVAGGGGWTSGPLVFFIEGDQKVATVNSGPITHFVGQPIEATVKKDKPQQIVLSWEIEAKDSANQYFRLGYRLNMLQGGAKAILSAQPLSYDNKWSNEGSCKKVKK